MKSLSIVVLCFLVIGCGLNPPQPPQPKGERIPVNKTNNPVASEANDVQQNSK